MFTSLVHWYALMFFSVEVLCSYDGVTGVVHLGPTRVTQCNAHDLFFPFCTVALCLL